MNNPKVPYIVEVEFGLEVFTAKIYGTSRLRWPVTVFESTPARGVPRTMHPDYLRQKPKKAYLGLKVPGCLTSPMQKIDGRCSKVT